MYQIQSVLFWIQIKKQRFDVILFLLAISIFMKLQPQDSFTPIDYATVTVTLTGGTFDLQCEVVETLKHY